MRRLVDITVAALLLTLTAPLQLVLALLIRRGSRGPAWYVPKMVGQHRALFPLLRFRTMAIHSPVGAPADARLTRVGRVIRNYSLDHVPMLWNVLFGHLTLVGPRPLEVEFVLGHDQIDATYFAVKPGVLNYAVLALGRQWTPSRAYAPALNQTLEAHYQHSRTWHTDLHLAARWIVALVQNRANVKARKPPDADVGRDAR